MKLAKRSKVLCFLLATLLIASGPINAKETSESRFLQTETTSAPTTVSGNDNSTDAPTIPSNSTTAPSVAPTYSPTTGPTEPTVAPTLSPTPAPTAPTSEPTSGPTTAAPTKVPTFAPTTNTTDEYDTSEPETPSKESQSLGRDPDIPSGDKIATASEVQDPYYSIPETFAKKGIFYNFTREATDILPASTVMSGEATLGTAIHGRVTKEGKPLIEYYPGNTPFLFTCMHVNANGFRPFMKNWVFTVRTCPTSLSGCRTLEAGINLQNIDDSLFNNNTKRQLRKKIYNGIPKSYRPRMPLGDNIGRHCDKIYNSFVSASGNKAYPHYVKSRIPVMFIDFNKHPGVTKMIKPAGNIRNSYNLYYNNPELYASYHDALGFIREAKNVIARQYGFGTIIDFHSHRTKRLRVDLASGYRRMTYDVQQNHEKTRAKLEANTMKRSVQFWLGFDYEKRGYTPYEYFFGNHSLGEALSMRGMMAAPSRAWYYFHVNDKGYFRGSSLHERMAMPSKAYAVARDYTFDNQEVANRPKESWYFDNSVAFNNYAIQVPIKYLSNVESRTKFINVFVESLLDISNDLWGLDLRETNVIPAYTPLATLYNSISELVTCENMDQHMIRSFNTTAKEGGFVDTQVCIEACRIDSNCKFIHLFASPSSTRFCHLLSECTKTSKSMDNRFHQVINMTKIYEAENA